MSRLIILLAILGIGLVLLILNHDSGRTFGMNNDDFGQLVASALWQRFLRLVSSEAAEHWEKG